MKGIIKNVSDFLKEQKWLFIIEDEMRVEYFIMEESLACNKLIVAASMVFLLPSITCPVIFPVVDWALVLAKRPANIMIVSKLNVFFMSLCLVLVFNYFMSNLGTMCYILPYFIFNGKFSG